MMQRGVMLIFASLVSLCAAAAPLKVVATLPVLANLAEKVGGEFVEVSSLARPNQDPHFVFPTPTLMKKARNAAVFIENGLSLEIWAQKVVDGSGNRLIQIGQPGRIIASRGILTLEVPQVTSRALGDVHPGGNPHVWLDPELAKKMAKNISDGLSKVDPQHAVQYSSRLKAFENEIDAKMSGWMGKAAALKGVKVVTYHKTFSYFARRFGFSVAAEIEEKPGISPSARYRDSLISQMKNEKISKILLELYYDRVAPDFIATKTGAKVIQLPIDVGADPLAMDYFSLIDLLLKRICADAQTNV